MQAKLGGALKGLVVGLLLAIAASSCTRPAPPPSPPLGATGVSTPPASPGEAPTARAEPTFYCRKFEGGSSGSVAFLKDVRIGRHEGFERVVLEFEPAPGEAPAVPPYTLQAAEPPFYEDPSGKPISVAGSSFWSLRIHSSRVNLSGPTPSMVYRGETEIRPGFPVLAEMKLSGDFEMVTGWIIGLNRRSCLRVFELGAPPRLVIDIQSP